MASSPARPAGSAPAFGSRAPDRPHHRSSPAPPGMACRPSAGSAKTACAPIGWRPCSGSSAATARPPPLVVRTCDRHARVRARCRPAPASPAPASEAEAVDPARPLGRAIADAFDSYGGWIGDHQRRSSSSRPSPHGDLIQFLSRDAQTGAIGPAPLPGGSVPAAARSARVRRERSTAPPVATCASSSAARASAQPHLPLGPPVAAVRRRRARSRHRSRRARHLERAAGRRAASAPTGCRRMLHPSSRRPTPPSPSPPASASRPAPPAASSSSPPKTRRATRPAAATAFSSSHETGPADIEGMKAATGILTARGGMTSHAGVIARITGKPCVAGVRDALASMPPIMSCRIGDRVLPRRRPHHHRWQRRQRSISACCR